MMQRFRLITAALLLFLLSCGEGHRPKAAQKSACKGRACLEEVDLKPEDALQVQQLAMRGRSFLQVVSDLLPSDQGRAAVPGATIKDVNVDALVENADESLGTYIGLVFLGVLVLAMVILGIWSCCQRQKTPEEQALEDEEAEEADAHLAAQEAVAVTGSRDEQLATLKAKKGRLMVGQVISKRKLQVVMEQILIREAELRNEQAPSAEEIRMKTEEVIQATNVMAEKRLLTALAYVAPFAMQTSRVTAALEARARSAQERLTTMAYEESIAMCGDLKGVFEIGDVQGSIFETLGKVEVPSLVTIIASAFAPAQLRLMYLTNIISAAQVFVVFIISSVVWLTITSGHCRSDFPAFPAIDNQLVKIWFEIDMVLTGVCLMIRVWVVTRISAVMQVVDKPPPVDTTDPHPVQAIRRLLDFYLTTGAEALASLDAIGTSYIYAMANWAVMPGLIWSIVGLDVVLNTTWKNCRTVSLLVLRVRAVFFLISLVPQLLYVVFFFATHVVKNDKLKISILSGALEADRAIGLGIPIASILAQSFMVTNRADTIRLRLRVVELRKQEMEKERKEAEATLKGLASAEAKTEAEIENLKKAYDKMKKTPLAEQIAQDLATKDQILAGAESVFKELNEKAKVAAIRAQSQVEEWKNNGDGPADFLGAAANYAAQMANDPTAFSAELAKRAREQAAAAGIEISEEDLANLAAKVTNAKEAAMAAGQKVAQSDMAKGLKSKADEAIHSDAAMALQSKAQAAMDSETAQKMMQKAEATAKAALDSDAAKKMQQKAEAIRGAASAAQDPPDPSGSSSYK